MDQYGGGGISAQILIDGEGTMCEREVSNVTTRFLSSATKRKTNG